MISQVSTLISIMISTNLKQFLQITLVAILLGVASAGVVLGGIEDGVVGGYGVGLGHEVVGVSHGVVGVGHGVVGVGHGVVDLHVSTYSHLCRNVLSTF